MAVQAGKDLLLKIDQTGDGHADRHNPTCQQKFSQHIRPSPTANDVTAQLSQPN